MSSEYQTPETESLRQQLYEVMADDALSLSEKQERALALGREYLDVENAHVERIDEAADVHEVVASVGEDFGVLGEGVRLPAATTYCRRTVESDSPVAISNAPEQGWGDDPAYREQGIDCYLGTTVFVRGEVYGTVCFVSLDARGRSFDPSEKAFVELVARLLGRELEAARHEDELAARERDLERAENKYETLVETAPDAILLADIGAGVVVDANEAATDLLGYDRAELVGMAQHELSPPNDRQQYVEEFERVLEGGGPTDRFADGTPLRVRRRDGTDVPVEISASAVELDGREFVQAIVRDISGRRERERELQVRDRAIEAASVGITIADATDDDLALVYANREFERLTGYDREEVLGENCRFLQGDQTDESSIETVRSALAAQEPATTELLNYRADGTPFWNELTVAPVADETGATTHFVGFQRDVTPRKRRERLIAVLNRVLRHNLRNDMTVVRGWAEMLAEEYDGQVAEAATRIADTATDLSALSEKARALETTLREPLEPEPRDVVADVDAVVADLREAHPDATFAVETPDVESVVTTERLRTALRELGENAAKHGGPSPTVTYHVESEDDGTVAVRVSDDGPGLGEVEKRVLGRGYETPLEHSQGLGLWLVNWIVTSVGGDVTVDVTDGTTVTVRIPADTTEPTDAGDDVQASRYWRGAIGVADR